MFFKFIKRSEDIHKWLAKIEAANLKFIKWMSNIIWVIAAILIFVSFLMNKNWQFLINGIAALLIFIILKKVVFWLILEK